MKLVQKESPRGPMVLEAPLSLGHPAMYVGRGRPVRVLAMGPWPRCRGWAYRRRSQGNHSMDPGNSGRAGPAPAEEEMS